MTQNICPACGEPIRHIATDILNTEETADFLRTPIATLRHWRAEGKGPHSFKIGRRVAYRRQDLDAWLDAQMKTPA